MNKISGKVFGILTACLLTLVACSRQATPQTSPTLPPETNILLTADAKMTQSAFETVVAQLTALSQVTAPESKPNLPASTNSPLPPPTKTPPTATKTSSPYPSNTPTPTETIVPCNRVAFVQDISIPPGTIMHPGDPFTKTWRIKNTGTCTWTEDYEIVFSEGEQMNGLTPIRLGKSVPPEEITDITILLLSPDTEDVYAGIWQVRDNNGQIIGEGTQYQTPLWVNISVTTRIRELDQDSLLDFAHNYCAANWFSTAGYLSCPGPEADFISGSVIKQTSPALEGGHTDDEPAIVVVPSAGDGGHISGRFPAIEIKNGDRFQGLVGCVDDRPNCSVTFQLDYRESGGNNVNLGTWQEIYDASFTRIDIDLDLLVGKLVEFTFTVSSEGDSTDDEVFWLAPKISRSD